MHDCQSSSKSQQIRLIILFLAALQVISQGITFTVMHLMGFNPPVQAHRVLLWVLYGVTAWMSILAGGFGFGKCSSLCVLASFGTLVLSLVEIVLAGVFVDSFVKVYPLFLGSVVLAVGLMIAGTYYRIRTGNPEIIQY